MDSFSRRTPIRFRLKACNGRSRFFWLILDFLAAKRQRDVLVLTPLELCRRERLDIRDRLGDARLQLVERSFVVFESRPVGTREARTGVLRLVGREPVHEIAAVRRDELRRLALGLRGAGLDAPVPARRRPNWV